MFCEVIVKEEPEKILTSPRNKAVMMIQRQRVVGSSVTSIAKVWIVVFFKVVPWSQCREWRNSGRVKQKAEMGGCGL